MSKHPEPTEEETGDFDEVLRAVADAPPLVPPDRRTRVEARLGTVLVGKYRLEGVLGVGGMAVVYRARHVNNGAERAIKMLLPEHATNEDIQRRFRHEGRLANGVQHPGAVSVIDDDVSDDGATFLVLELLHGLSCEQLRDRLGGKLPPEAACHVALRTLEVLEAAHEHGIVHRDVKPANLFVVSDGTIKVLDFGIARLRDPIPKTGPGTSPGTGPGTCLGTRGFMAPEQALGEAGDVDERADVWGVGATLFALVSGLTARRGGVSLATIAPQTPGPLIDVVDGALQLDRNVRWESARAMRIALEERWRARFGRAPSQRGVAELVAEAQAEPGSTVDHGATHSPSSMSSSTSARPVSEARKSMGPSVRARGWWLTGASVVVPAALIALWLQEHRLEGPHGSPAATESTTNPSELQQAPLQIFPQPAPTPSETRRSLAPRVGVPRSCGEAHAAGVQADGPVTIDPDGSDRLRPFEVYCAHMGVAESLPPAEYLSLVGTKKSTGPNANTTVLVHKGGKCPCPDVVRHFQRVRLDAKKMTIDPKDDSFVTDEPPLDCEKRHPIQCGEWVSIAWGVPTNDGAPDQVATASIDLRDTPFTVDSKFELAVPVSVGSANPSNRGKIVNFVVSGAGASIVTKRGDGKIKVVQDP